MWFRKKKQEEAQRPPLHLFNTLSGTSEIFTLPQMASRVRMYNCGPTVYGTQHIGNLSMYVFTDILRKTLEYNGFTVRQVINITDIGHLTSDADEGEDKMTKGLRAEGLAPTLENMRALAEKYTEQFKKDIAALNVDIASIEFPRASDHIPAQIAMIRSLEDRSYAYKAADGVYFDTAAFPAYGKLGNIALAGQREGARVALSAQKRNPTDFALWKFDSSIGWESPWGKGFPGWHIECSAMIHSLLGEPIDIHTGGIEHIPIHHNNEIAQTECATGRKLSRFWMHRAHIQLEGGKIAKSGGNAVLLSDIVSRGYDPLVLRYLFLGAHYRTSMNFTWESLEAAKQAYRNLLQRMKDLGEFEGGVAPTAYNARFHERINDDLDTPGALAVLWEMVKDSSLRKEDVAAGIREMDTVLNLSLGHSIEKRVGIVLTEYVALGELPPRERGIVEERERARAAKDFPLADTLRAQLESAGFSIEDAASGPRISKKN